MAHVHAAAVNHAGVALVLLCGGVAAMSAASAAPGMPDSAGTPPPDPSANLAVSGVARTFFDFDMPAQSLGDALDSYAVLTRRPALFSSEMVAGRISAAVRGRYQPAEALRMLLDGTGIVAERINAGPAEAFVLREVRAPSPSMQIALVSAGDYPGLVQERLWNALCHDARTAPGSYRALLRFRVDAEGRVRQTRLFDSTGDARRDAAILDVFQRMRMEEPPPTDMPQPLTMIVLPRSAGHVDAGLRCDRAGSGVS